MYTMKGIFKKHEILGINNTNRAIIHFHESTESDSTKAISNQ